MKCEYCSNEGNFVSAIGLYICPFCLAAMNEEIDLFIKETLKGA